MNSHNIAISVSNQNQNVTAYQTIDSIKKAGFKNVFIQWYNKEQNISQEKQLDYIIKSNLNIIFAHLGYKDINNLWLDNEIGNNLISSYKNDIKTCNKNNIPMVVMHISAGKSVPKYNELGLKRLQEIADYADKLDIKVAFENTEAKGYLDYVIKNINNKNVGICFDSGHYHAHFKDDFDFNKFKNRIFAIHLHDNDKTSDLHLIPFDGTLDWNNVISNLKNCNYNGPITLESCYRYDYLNNSLDNFYKKCYNTSIKLEKLLKEK